MIESEAEDTAAEVLAVYFSGPDRTGLWERNLGIARTLLFDYLGVTLAGSRTEPALIAAELVREQGSAAVSSILGRRLKASPAEAGFVNAISAHSLELDDTDDHSMLHFSAVVVSAALAVAERERASGTELLVAILVGCEMMSRISRATRPALRDRGFHGTAACGAFAAAIAATRLLKLSAAQTVSALGLAGTQACGLFDVYGPSMQKRLNPGSAARNGVTAALLAAMGFSGSELVFEGSQGFGRAFAGGIDTGALLEGLGTELPVAIEYKPYSAARPIHNAIDCALSLGLEPGAETAQRLAEVVIDRSPMWANYHLEYAPRNFYESMYSLPYSVALAFVYGAALPQQYRDGLADARVLELARQVTTRTDATLTQPAACRMTVTLSDGETRSVTVRSALGSLARPLSREDHLAKFSQLLAAEADAPAAAAVMAAVEPLASPRDLTKLIGLVA